MQFSRRRGRPKLARPEKDLGTKELRAKRKVNMTIEPLDLCLKQQIISEDAYQAGLRLCWLYRLHFGSPHLKAHNIEEINGKPTHYEDEAWLARRFEEYLGCLKELQKISAKSVVMNICVFGQRPLFLMPEKKGVSDIAKRCQYQKLLTFKEGMECLMKYFGKKIRKG